MLKIFFTTCLLFAYICGAESKTYKKLDSSVESHKKIMGTWYLNLDDLVKGFEKSLSKADSRKRFPGAYEETYDWVSSFALTVNEKSISGYFGEELKLNINEIKIEGNVYTLKLAERFLPKLKVKLEAGKISLLEPSGEGFEFLTFTQAKLKENEQKAHKEKVITWLKKQGLKEDFFFYQGQNMQPLLKKALLRDPALSKYEDDHGNSMLYLIVRAQNLELMNYVLENGADPNTRTKEERITGGQASIHYLAKYTDDRNFDKHKPFIDLLIKHKADLDVFDSFEKTPLMHAARSQNIKTVKYLLEKGADISKTALDGNTFMHEACSAFEDMDFYTMLKKQDESLFYTENRHGYRPIDGVFSGRVPNQFKQFLKLGIDFSKVNSLGENILHRLYLDHDKIKTVLVSVERIDIDNASKAQGTILRQAMIKGDEKLVKLLLEFGAIVPEDYDPTMIKDEALTGRRALRRKALQALNEVKDQRPELIVSKEIHALIKTHLEKQKK